MYIPIQLHWFFSAAGISKIQFYIIYLGCHDEYISTKLLLIIKHWQLLRMNWTLEAFGGKRVWK